MSTEAGALPNAFIIGAAKSGTTSLHRYLGQHRDVFAVEPKEPRFFAYDGPGPPQRGPGQAEWARREVVTDEAAFRALFAPGREMPVRLDSSVVYLDLPVVADRIRARVPEARFAVVLRDPAERAWSQWVANRRHSSEPLDFDAAWDAEAERTDAGWNWLFQYRARGEYASLLAQWLERIPAEDLLIEFHDDLLADPAAVARRCCHHFGVSDDFRPDTSVRHNQGVLNRRMRRPARPPLPADVRRRLTRHYEPGILALQELTGRDLSHWR